MFTYFGNKEMLIDHTLRWKRHDWNVEWSSVEGYKGLATMCTLGIIEFVVSFFALLCGAIYK
jgi:hypothetical protein